MKKTPLLIVLIAAYIGLAAHANASYVTLDNIDKVISLAGEIGDFAQKASSGQMVVPLAALPEPSTWAMIGMGIPAILAARKFRKRA